MQVEIREGGDGVACWNADAIAQYAAGVDDREAQFRAANPDLVITAGRIFCTRGLLHSISSDGNLQSHQE